MSKKPDENKPNIDIEDLGIENSAGYKNLIAIRDYTKATRQLVKDLEKEMQNVINQLQQEKVERQQLQDQIVQILQRLI
ncbi:MAG: hypothetical protein OEV22_20460 [Deltaproteobacteria bacterium]|jgi:gas vesicle protein|nr:hypothetical protein [Deltaproteobacteria bacterium]